jgi:hypothetical protein
MLNHINSMIYIVTTKTNSNEEPKNLIISFPMRQFQLMKRFLQLTNKRRCNNANKYLVLQYINLFIEISNDKITIHIHSMNHHLGTRSKRKHTLNVSHVGNRSKGISVVNTFLLRESLGDELIFMFLNTTIQRELGFVVSFTSNNIVP